MCSAMVGAKKGKWMGPASVIRKEYGSSSNFMTPQVLWFGWVVKGELAYELSKGAGIRPGSTLYGVSVVRLYANGETDRETDLSGCFPSQALAMRHIAKLQASEEAP